MIWSFLGLSTVVFFVLHRYVPAFRHGVHDRLLFPLMYAAYTQTPVGPMVHRGALKKARAKPPHTALPPPVIDCQSFVVVLVPFLEDNLGYFLIDVNTGTTAAVDPADAETVEKLWTDVVAMHKAGENEVLSRVRSTPRLRFVLTTHKHWDHAGGNVELSQRLPGLTVVGGVGEHVPGVTQEVAHASTLQIGDTKVTVLSTPCHTTGHIVFYASSSAGNGNGAVFTGDCLFSGGVGMFFEGSPSQMHASLQRIKALPPGTQVFPGHDMTESNLEFAVTVEPSNEETRRRYSWAKAQRASRQSTLPSTLETELATNPFLRLSAPEVVAACGGVTDSVTVLGKLRGLKSNFKRT